MKQFRARHPPTGKDMVMGHLWAGDTYKKDMVMGHLWAGDTYKNFLFLDGRGQVTPTKNLSSDGV